MSWVSAAFVDRKQHLRNGWWVAAFLIILAGALFSVILMAAGSGREVSIWEQVGIIAVATVAIQLLRRRPLTEVTGRPGASWWKQAAAGVGWGAALMIAPALLLTVGGVIRWEAVETSPMALAQVVFLMLGVAIAEELLFRGVLFQRLIAGIGIWPAQFVIAAFFVLTHLGNPGMDGATRIWASVNIFIASLVFGFAYARTRSLALPIGLHFMANVTQGVLLGFGVSGNAEPSLLAPHFVLQADWLTGGDFGLEASLPGLIAVSSLLAVFWQSWGADRRHTHADPSTEA